MSTMCAMAHKRAHRGLGFRRGTQGAPGGGIGPDPPAAHRRARAPASAADTSTVGAQGALTRSGEGWWSPTAAHRCRRCAVARGGRKRSARQARIRTGHLSDGDRVTATAEGHSGAESPPRKPPPRVLPHRTVVSVRQRCAVRDLVAHAVARQILHDCGAPGARRQGGRLLLPLRAPPTRRGRRPAVSRSRPPRRSPCSPAGATHNVAGGGPGHGDYAYFWTLSRA